MTEEAYKGVCVASKFVKRQVVGVTRLGDSRKLNIGEGSVYRHRTARADRDGDEEDDDGGRHCQTGR